MVFQTIVNLWWEQYVKVPWPDEVATWLKAGTTKDKEEDEEGENQRIRRTLIRTRTQRGFRR